MSSPYFRPRFPEGWFAPRAPHLSPLDGRQNQEIVSRLESLDFEVHRDHPQHHYAVAYLRDVFEQVLVPLSYLDEKDALGLCVVNCNLATLLEREEDARCLVYLMRRGRLRNRTFKGGEIETLHQGRSSAGAESYPGDRAFSDGNLPTVQLHMLRVRDLDRARVFENLPAVAVRLHQQEDMLVHDE